MNLAITTEGVEQPAQGGSDAAQRCASCRKTPTGDVRVAQCLHLFCYDCLEDHVRGKDGALECPACVGLARLTVAPGSVAGGRLESRFSVVDYLPRLTTRLEDRRQIKTDSTKRQGSQSKGESADRHCPFHRSRPLTSYCFTCNRILCPRCLETSDHIAMRHDVRDVEAAAARCRYNTVLSLAKVTTSAALVDNSHDSDTITNITSVRTRAEVHLSNLIKRAQEHKREVRRNALKSQEQAQAFYRRLRLAVDACQEDTLGRIKEHFETQTGKLEKAEQLLRQERDTVQRTQSVTTDLLNGGDPDFLLAAPWLKSLTATQNLRCSLASINQPDWIRFDLPKLLGFELFYDVGELSHTISLVVARKAMFFDILKDGLDFSGNEPEIRIEIAELSGEQYTVTVEETMKRLKKSPTLEKVAVLKDVQSARSLLTQSAIHSTPIASAKTTSCPVTTVQGSSSLSSAMEAARKAAGKSSHGVAVSSVGTGAKQSMSRKSESAPVSPVEVGSLNVSSSFLGSGASSADRSPANSKAAVHRRTRTQSAPGSDTNGALAGNFLQPGSVSLLHPAKRPNAQDILDGRWVVESEAIVVPHRVGHFEFRVWYGSTCLTPSPISIISLRQPCIFFSTTPINGQAKTILRSGRSELFVVDFSEPAMVVATGFLPAPVWQWAIQIKWGAKVTSNTVLEAGVTSCDFNHRAKYMGVSQGFSRSDFASSSTEKSDASPKSPSSAQATSAVTTSSGKPSRIKATRHLKPGQPETHRKEFLFTIQPVGCRLQESWSKVDGFITFKLDTRENSLEIFDESTGERSNLKIDKPSDHFFLPFFRIPPGTTVRLVG